MIPDVLRSQVESETDIKSIIEIIYAKFTVITLRICMSTFKELGFLLLDVTLELVLNI